MDGLLWGLVIVGGPVLLALAIFLFGNRQRKMTKRENDLSQQTARENWGKEEIH